MLKSLSGVRNFVLESNRLNPVLVELTRSFPHDVELRGYHIPAFTSLNPSIHATGRSETNFKNAKQFCPHREDRNAFAANTFGHGARMCPGRRVAEMEIQLALATVVQKFKVSSSKPGVPETFSSILMTPDPTDQRILTFTPRQTN